jgi:alkylated DNA repair dioxygenase AlkB
VQPKTLIIMSGDARNKWTHEIPSVKEDRIYNENGNYIDLKSRDKRVSITFRSLKE